MRPLISIVIVNSDGLADTLRCLESIERYLPDAAALGWASDELCEIIVVDNRSRDGCLDVVGRQFPQARLLLAPERQGFAKNYNQGMRVARGEYILVLNNDTLVQAGALTTLLRVMAERESYGMAGPRLVSADGAVQLDCARDFPQPRSYVVEQLVLDHGLPLGRIWLSVRRRRLGKRASGPVECIGGACMLVRRAAIEQAGMLDEEFVFYYEDVEWCHRLTCSGWRIGYVAEATVTHLGDRSLSKVKVWAKQSEFLSAMRYFRRYHRLTSTGERLLRAVTALSWLVRGIAFLLAEGLAGREGHARAYLVLFSSLMNG